MGDIKLFIPVLLTNSLVFTMEFGKVSSCVGRIHLHFKTEEPITESVHIQANLNRVIGFLFLLGFGLVLRFWIFLFSYLSSSPTIFYTKHSKHSEDCATAIFFYDKKQRCKTNARGCDMKSWVGVCRPNSQTSMGQCQWGGEGSRTGVTTPALPCWILLWEKHAEKNLKKLQWYMQNM